MTIADAVVLEDMLEQQLPGFFAALPTELRQQLAATIMAANVAAVDYLENHPNRVLAHLLTGLGTGLCVNEEVNAVTARMSVMLNAQNIQQPQIADAVRRLRAMW